MHWLVFLTGESGKWRKLGMKEIELFTKLPFVPCFPHVSSKAFQAHGFITNLTKQTAPCFSFNYKGHSIKYLSSLLFLFCFLSLLVKKKCYKAPYMPTNMFVIIKNIIYIF